ncbi:adenylate/guanylate cyclase domain-containing protein [Marimonas sp. MJW-29]|uniref:Adenylate/guanylate cyclase domain-containing protein n=1 Tax=Sulfitobacter sediminis TaxID=3234186 RepID=A0ABV3RV88_9RHOB
MERKFAAIMAIDVVGYSAMMADDEIGTLHAVKAQRRTVVEPTIAENGGRIFKLIGDGMLVEFPSAVSAVKSALSVQNIIVEAQDPIRLRIGISMGDVIVDNGDLYGHGVNIAARLEAIAGIGGICVSDVVHQQIRLHALACFTETGDVQVKNIDTPMRVWHWPDTPPSEDAQDTVPKVEKPSIAVLSFENLASSAEQDILCEGIAEEIVTALSKIERIAVMDPASTRVYRNKVPDVRDIGREQNVRYVLKGSVRKQGERLRVIAQLADAKSGQTIFSERYSRQIEDIFDIQDEITREIVSSLQVHLTDGEQARLWASGTRDLEAWERCIRGAELIDNHVKEDTDKGRWLLQEALEIDPSYAVAWCKLGWAHWSDARHNWTSDPMTSLAEAFRAAEQAREIDPSFAEPFALMAMSAMQGGDFAAASDYIDEALERASGQSFVLAIASMVLALCGRPIDALDTIRKAMQLCPIYPDWYRMNLGRNHFLIRDFDAAIKELGELCSSRPDFSPILLLAAYCEAGRREDAIACLRRAQADGQSLSIGGWVRNQAFSDPSIVDGVVVHLRDLGLPD